tara:strand:+ start:345 stop:965 length:621 start_codon:yes stop_codon:yes gene_type:complete
MEERHHADNLYRAPEADVTALEREAEGPLFYVVSPAKFTLLFWITMGVYDLYWQYKNWYLYREARGEGGLPVLRALFSIFFAPPLFHRMAKEAREAGVEGGAPPTTLAVVYVVFTLASNLSGFSNAPGAAGVMVQLLGLGTLLPLWWTLLQCQKRVNATVGDKTGRANHRLTWANWIWIVLGGLLWLVTLLSLVVWVAALVGVLES